MSKIDLNYHHTLDVEKCREVVDTMIARLAHKYSLQSHWNGDGSQLKFNRAGIDGLISLEHQLIHIQVNLGFLLAPMRTVIEREIMSHLRKELDEALPPS